MECSSHFLEGFLREIRGLSEDGRQKTEDRTLISGISMF
ncbi:hypothetical protein LEP1GSC047_4117 [Leptospira inadai serovar Lyme str. 10]|uniref:Uncharacterized protein n=1 Tax=Leptospira inadai serovar Lyme str. 10 TaxID=1049790 RepID=V6HXE7_9LEPT|nr:hypothetical protein LEP1GSC047_4117 [Leptospira inadai serovar Lyme str. 10]